MLNTQQITRNYDLANGIAAYDTRDYATAHVLLKPFADQGDAEAQYLIGYMCACGHGGNRDDVLAYSWFDRAAANAHRTALKSRDIIAKRMTATQIAAAQKMARR